MSRVIQYTSKFKIRWDLLAVLLVVISLLFVPYEVVYLHESSMFTTFLYFVLCDFFLIDIYLQFRTSKKVRNETINNPEKIKKLYFNRNFWIDLL